MSEDSGEQPSGGIGDALRVQKVSSGSYDESQLGRVNPILEAENLGRGR